MAFTIQKALRLQVPIKIALIGPSGSGKTKSSLIICKGFGGKTVMIDTENRRGLSYADLYDYEHVPFDPPFTPERFIEAMHFALDKGAENLIIDSASHEWIGRGGCLEIHDREAQTSRSKNDFAAWRPVSPRHNAFVDEVIRFPKNLIVCLRGKDEYVLSGGEGEKKTPKKVGVGAQMREGL
jgi:hypothetical protein